MGIGFASTDIMAYSAHTQSEAVAWAQSQLGKALDYDGQYGAQCVDLICYYYQYLGTTSPGGNAEAYRRNNLPSGWIRVYGNYQQETLLYGSQVIATVLIQLQHMDM